MSERDNVTFSATPSTPSSHHIDPCFTSTPTSVQEPYPGWPGVARDPHLLSAFEAAMTVNAANDLGKLDLKMFSFQRVLELPQLYDGNLIFELPFVVRNAVNKRNGLRAGMDRRQDCFLWTRLITTEAGHGWKKQFDISHMYCVGSLRCDNLNCSYRAEHGEANVSDWKTGIHRDRKYVVGDFVHTDGHRCPHCGFLAKCVQGCAANIFFVLPSKGKKQSPSTEEASHMSRCAIHVGNHCHHPRSSAPRHLIDLVKESVKEECFKNQRGPPSAVRLQATASVINKLESSGLTLEMTEDEKHSLFKGISSVAHPDKLKVLVRVLISSIG
ncbi:hypothetical protein R1sor_010350 [Riccia sorocarpa]|uniref:Uncharacterized protein n=1 Tax=Riccia sorocarpa TaxID=122646 RepID=A0ABD3I3V5_9MARC